MQKESGDRMKVSVIIPVYNVEPYIKECLDSVLGQTLREIEVICINDRGKDGSWDIVKKAAQEDGRLRLFEQEENRGLAAARNKGLDLAQGKYVYFLDSDDKLREDALKSLYERGEKEDLEVQVFGASFIYEKESLEQRRLLDRAGFKREYPEISDGPEMFIKWMEVWDWLASQPRYFYRRCFLEENHIRFQEGMLHEDEPFAFEVLMKARRMEATSQPFFIRRFRSGSIMTATPGMANLEGVIRILECVRRVQRNLPDRTDLNQAIRFYMYKIFKDGVRKYKASKNGGQEMSLLKKQSELLKSDSEAEMIYDLMEAFAMWEGS